MRRSKSMSPKVEGLESLLFLSADLPGAAAAAHVAAHHHHGDDHAATEAPDAPTTDDVAATAVDDVAATAADDVVTLAIDEVAATAVDDLAITAYAEDSPTADAPATPADETEVDGLPISVTGTRDPAAQGNRPAPAPNQRTNGVRPARPAPTEAVRPVDADAGLPGAPEVPRRAPRPPARPAINLDNLDLSSTMRGNYRLQIAPDGSSGSFQLQGIGNVRGLGPARIATNYVADGTSAPETMSVSITTRRGSLMLQVGRRPGDVDPDPSTARLRYEVVAATGALAGARGSGLLDMTLRPQMRTLGASGQMSMTIRPDTA